MFITDRVPSSSFAGTPCCHSNNSYQIPLQKLVCYRTHCRKKHKVDAHTLRNRVTAHRSNLFFYYLCNRSRIDGSCNLYISVRSTVKLKSNCKLDVYSCGTPATVQKQQVHHTVITAHLISINRRIPITE